MKRLYLVIISALILIGCGGSPQVDTKLMTFFEGRVVVKVTERIGGARPNDRPEYLTFRFTDVGDYKVSFTTTHSCGENAWWKCPKDFNVSIDSGTREVSQTFDSTLGLVPSFSIKVDRNGQSQSCNYSNISSKNSCNRGGLSYNIPTEQKRLLFPNELKELTKAIRNSLHKNIFDTKFPLDEVRDVLNLR